MKNHHPPKITTAVILAAGKGSRLKETDMPKPLFSLVGVPLIARVMATAAEAGICRFVVVIGFQAERLRERLPEYVPRGCTLELIENPQFEKPNGVSLKKASIGLQEPFVLLMSDHIFSADRLKKAIEHFTKVGRCTLVVENKHLFDGDAEDATRVATTDGKVGEIGKGLEAYDAIDTGMFILHADAVTAALDRADPAPSISDGMRILSKAGKLDAVFINGGYWQDIDTIEDVAAAEQKLYGSLRNAPDGVLARVINRRISLFLSKRL